MDIDRFLLDLVVVLFAAKAGGELAHRLNQPAVLGELLGGIIVGSSVLGVLADHIHFLHLLTISSGSGAYPVLFICAQIGMILLLFETGLETDMDELFKLGASALWVACLGVALSFAGGYFVMRLMHVASAGALFVGAAVSATSVGITARSFSDLNKSRSKEAKIVLGAAVADDIIGLIILAVMSGLAVNRISLVGACKTALAAILFLAAAVVLGRYFAPKIMDLAHRMRTKAALATASLIFCFILAIVANYAAGLSPIIGAFAAGLVLAKTSHKLHFVKQLQPVASVFVPVFFVLTGALMPISAINPGSATGRTVILQTLLLFGVAAVAKIIAGVSVPERKTNRIAVGIGMIPRGEVVLIFAGYGIQSGALTQGLYTAVLLVVMLTTFVTPPLLKAALGKSDNEKGGLQKSEAVSQPVPAV